jgi:MoaA/NifB/PqqE/SkfB family radical SAM enzyme
MIGRTKAYDQQGKRRMKRKDTDFSYVQGLKGKRVPLVVDFELTDQCNLNCRHCCIRSDDPRSAKAELTTKQACRVLGKIRDGGVVYLNITGGEPLLRPDFRDIYLFAKKKGFAVTVLTNGTLITPDIIKLFQRHPPLMLEITSYGHSRATYEAVTRVPGSFDRFQRALRLLESSGLRMNVKRFVMRRNYLEAMSLATQDRGWVTGIPIILRRDRDAKKNAEIKQQRLTASEIARFLDRCLVGSLRRRAKSGEVSRYLDGCCCDTVSGSVLSDGTLVWCHLMPPSPFNLKTMSYNEAWQALCPTETLSAQQDRACGKCAHVMHCRWCPGRAFLETGSTVRKIPYLCGIMKRVYKRKGR